SAHKEDSLASDFFHRETISQRSQDFQCLSRFHSGKLSSTFPRNSVYNAQSSSFPVNLTDTDRSWKNPSGIIAVYRNKLPWFCLCRDLIGRQPQAVNIRCQKILTDNPAYHLYF